MFDCVTLLINLIAFDIETEHLLTQIVVEIV